MIRDATGRHTQTDSVSMGIFLFFLFQDRSPSPRPSSVCRPCRGWLEIEESSSPRWGTARKDPCLSTQQALFYVCFTHSGAAQAA